MAILEEMKQVNVAGGTDSEISARQPCDRQTAGKTPLTAMGDLFGDADSPESEQNISLLLRPHVAQMAKKYLPSPDPQCALSASFPLPGI